MRARDAMIICHCGQVWTFDTCSGHERRWLRELGRRETDAEVKARMGRAVAVENLRRCAGGRDAGA